MTRLLVVDDHQIVRAGIKQLLSEYEEFTVAGEAGSGADAVKMVRESDWDVVLLDITMPDMNGVDTLKQIKRSKPDLPVLILTMHPEENYAINLLRAGASGYLNKVCTPEELVGAIRAVASGRRYVSPALGAQLAGDLSGDGHTALHTELSKREFQVFCKLAAGQTVSEIADELFLSVKTVSTYRSRILEKMGMKTSAQVTYYAIKHGLIQ
jgi:two-component system, NarL family, invasion response regulator UvrY